MPWILTFISSSNPSLSPADFYRRQTPWLLDRISFWRLLTEGIFIFCISTRVLANPKQGDTPILLRTLIIIRRGIAWKTLVLIDIQIANSHTTFKSSPSGYHETIFFPFIFKTPKTYSKIIAGSAIIVSEKRIRHRVWPIQIPSGSQFQKPCCDCSDFQRMETSEKDAEHRSTGQIRRPQPWIRSHESYCRANRSEHHIWSQSPWQERFCTWFRIKSPEIPIDFLDR